MRHYVKAQKIVTDLTLLLERHPITTETALLWFEAAHDILEIAWRIRRDAWRVLSHEDRLKLIKKDPKLSALQGGNEP